MPTRIEANNERIFPDEPPASYSHQLPVEESELEKAHFSKESVQDFVNQVQAHSDYYIKHFELDLEKSGLLSTLEEAGVLPLDDASPTPASSQEVVPDNQAIGHRGEILKNLYIGTVIGHLFEDLFPKSNNG